jgi:hypothetical protein
VGPDDEPFAEGITDVYETAADAEAEGLRDGADKAWEFQGQRTPSRFDRQE